MELACIYAHSVYMLAANTASSLVLASKAVTNAIALLLAGDAIQALTERLK